MKNNSLTVKFIGVRAVSQDHSCILVESDKVKLLIEPTQRVQDVDGVIVCDIDPDEYSEWQYYANQGIPIYSSFGVKQFISNEKLKAVIKPITKNFKIGTLELLIEKVPVEPHHPMIGIKFPQYNLAIIPELPSYLSKAFIKSISLPAHHIIVGLGSWKKSDHKISFLDFLDAIEKCKQHQGLLSITLTNFRRDLELHKTEALKLLKSHWDIPVFWAHKNMKLSYSRNNRVTVVEKALEIEKLHLDEFRKTGVDHDLKHVKTRWREVIADLRYLANSGYPRLKRGEKWGNWTLEDILKYFGACIDALRSVKFIIPERKNSTSFWKCYWEAKKKGYIKSEPPHSPAEIKAWNEQRRQLIRLKSLDRKFLYRWIVEKALHATWYSKARPAYRFDIDLIKSDIQQLGWDKKELLIDCKADGLRVTAMKIHNKAVIFVDPADVKHKSPNITSRLPEIASEIREHFPDNTVVDCELISILNYEVLHRTVTNSILNSRINPKKLVSFPYLFVFDVLYYKGRDIRKLPLSERLKYLAKVPATEHIIVERQSRILKPGFGGYIINGGDISSLKKAWDLITHDKCLKLQNKFIRFAAEGIMVKTMDHPYEYPQNKGWAKCKVFHEIDGVILQKKLVKGSKATWNYLLGLDISEHYAKTLASMEKEEWYNAGGVLVDGKLLRGKEILDVKKGRWVMIMTKTDNTDIKGQVGDILRIAAEEVMRYDNPEYPDYPRYSFYIGRALELVPEKHVSDSLLIVDRLAALQPKRMSIEQLARLRAQKLPEAIRKLATTVAALSDNALIELKKELQK